MKRLPFAATVALIMCVVSTPALAGHHYYIEHEQTDNPPWQAFVGVVKCPDGGLYNTASATGIFYPKELGYDDTCYTYVMHRDDLWVNVSKTVRASSSSECGKIAMEFFEAKVHMSMFEALKKSTICSW
jgi:hypothetical protein